MKRVLAFFLVFLILVGCSSSKVSNAVDVDNLIESGKYSKAADLIKKNDLLNKKDVKTSHDYNNVIKYVEIQKLFDEKKYKEVLARYVSTQFNDKTVKKDAIKLVNGSFEELINQNSVSSNLK
ncbi:outer membrane protein assembly factor BamD, partial [Neobacillus dielmonensis]|uniref:hypothetical protein n=1 Tax=Neobacillus dielmonensis TaxID=1347369 RepID=UPI0005A97FD4